MPPALDHHFTSILLFLSDAPRITLAPTDQKVKDGGIASFFCRASGNPAADIHWRKSGKRVGESHRRYDVEEMPYGSVLRVDPVRAVRDDSEFECVADNGIGEPATASARLIVYPEDESKWHTYIICPTSVAELNSK